MGQSRLTRRDVKMIARAIRAIVKIEQRWAESEMGAANRQDLRLQQARFKLTDLLDHARNNTGSTHYNIFNGEKIEGEF